MNWQVFWIGVIAVSVAILATIQIVLLLRIAKLAQQATAAIEEVRSEIKPLVGKVHRIADDAARATALALAQVERVDRLLTSTAERVDDAVSLVRSSVAAPLKGGSVMLGALRAVMTLVSEWRSSRQAATREDEDALFVG